MTSTQPRLRIAMQKSGRLSEDTQALFKRCGLKLNLADRRLLAETLPSGESRQGTIYDHPYPFYGCSNARWRKTG